jgi:hypothetical protein
MSGLLYTLNGSNYIYIDMVIDEDDMRIHSVMRVHCFRSVTMHFYTV